MDGITEEELESKKRVNEIIAFYNREAHKTIQNFIEVYKPENYQVTPFAVECISCFLHEWHYYQFNLPDGVWTKVIKMYMELVEIDWDFLDAAHAYLRHHRH